MWAKPSPEDADTSPIKLYLPANFRYISLEDLQNRNEANDDPRGFLQRLENLPGIILDEAQNTPDDLANGLLPNGETPTTSLDGLLLSGLFPPIHDRDLEPATWWDGYVRTYVERDVRSLANIGNLEVFSRFLGLCAGRVGQLLNNLEGTYSRHLQWDTFFILP